MPAVVIDITKADDIRDVVHRAVEALSSGQLVVVPTETVYGIAASALQPKAVNRLFDLKQRDATKPFAFAIRSADEALDYVPNLSPLGMRIARRSWPGPLTLVADLDHPESVVHQLDPAVQAATTSQGTVGLRVPANELLDQILRLVAGPIVLTSANLSGQPAATAGQTAVDALTDHVDLILNDGATHFGAASTVAHVQNDEIKILREGVIDAVTIDQQGGFIGVVVCTGNTCRSPMGEAILKKRISERIGCKFEDLTEHGITILSAGIAAQAGLGPANQSVDVMQGLGLDISQHQTRPVTARLANFADLILTMTDGHRQAIISQWPSLESRVKTLRCDGGDISDPIGSPVEVYQQCAAQIDEQVKQWMDRIDFQQFNRSRDTP